MTHVKRSHQDDHINDSRNILILYCNLLVLKRSGTLLKHIMVNIKFINTNNYMNKFGNEQCFKK